MSIETKHNLYQPAPSSAIRELVDTDSNLQMLESAVLGLRRRKDAVQLIAARGAWVPLPKIVECAAQYNARIFELRRLGFRITNQTRDVSGHRHSWFRLESIPADVRNPQEIRDLTVPTTGPFPEFGSVAPETEYPD